MGLWAETLWAEILRRLTSSGVPRTLGRPYGLWAENLWAETLWTETRWAIGNRQRPETLRASIPNACR